MGKFTINSIYKFDLFFFCHINCIGNPIIRRANLESDSAAYLHRQYKSQIEARKPHSTGAKKTEKVRVNWRNHLFFNEKCAFFVLSALCLRNIPYFCT